MKILNIKFISVFFVSFGVGFSGILLAGYFQRSLLVEMKSPVSHIKKTPLVGLSQDQSVPKELATSGDVASFSPSSVQTATQNSQNTQQDPANENDKQREWEKSYWAQELGLTHKTNFLERLASVGNVDGIDVALETQLLLTNWSNISPELAWQWIQDNPEKVQDTRSEFKVMLKYLALNPTEAEYELAQLSVEEEGVRHQAIQAFVSTFGRDINAAKEWLSKLTSQDVHGQAVYELLKYQEGPDVDNHASIQLLQESMYGLPEGAVNELAFKIGINMTNKLNVGFEESFNSLNNFDPTLQSHIASGMVVGFSSRQPASFMREKINLLPSGDIRDKAVQLFIESNTRSEFDALFDLAANVEDDAVRASSVANLMSQWLNAPGDYDKDKFSALISSTEGLSEDKKQAFLNFVSDF